MSLFLFLLGACVSVGERVCYMSAPVPGGQKRMSNSMEKGLQATVCSLLLVLGTEPYGRTVSIRNC